MNAASESMPLRKSTGFAATMMRRPGRDGIPRSRPPSEMREHHAERTRVDRTGEPNA